MAIAAGANPSAGTEPGLQANWHFPLALQRLHRQPPAHPEAGAGLLRRREDRLRDAAVLAIANHNGWRLETFDKALGKLAVGASRFERLKQQEEALRAQIETFTAEIASLATSFTTGNHEMPD